MAKIKQHPNEPTLFMYWDVATDSPHAFSTTANEYGSSWSWNGDFEKPTVTPSILDTSDCYVMENGTRISPYRNHIFIRDGKIEYLSDSTHGLAGKTVEMIDFPDEW